MLSSITSLSSLLLLAFCIQAMSAREEASANEMLLPADLRDTKVEEAGFVSREDIQMILFEWMYKESENVTQLKVCAQQPLRAPNDVNATNPTLLCQVNGGEDLKNIEGRVLEEEINCSVFIENSTVPLAKDNTRYQLSIMATNEITTIFRSGSISFGMPVETSTVSCNGKNYTRASGFTNKMTLSLDHPCIKVDQKLGADVCYLEGEFSSSFFCYTDDKTDLRVCLQGSSMAIADEADGQLSISYLAYEGAVEPAEAHLSLEFAGHEPTDSMEALIWKQSESSATSCLGTNCPIPDFTQGFARYDVCAVTLDGGVPVQTSTSSITDLNADAFAYNGSPLLQFAFTNVNDERVYIAYVKNNAAANVTVDCSAVPLNSICLGYFEEYCAGNVTVAVQYADAKMIGKGNKIFFLCHQ